MKFDLESLTLSGTFNELHHSNSKLLFKPSIELILTAIDPVGKSITQNFRIEVKLSLEYFIKALISSITLLLSVLGLRNYRDEIHEVFCKKKYQYKLDKEILVEEEYKVQIPLLKEKLIKPYIVWSKLQEKSEEYIDVAKVEKIQLNIHTEKVYKVLREKSKGEL